ncbi:hypothetical protein R3P38DRAFT_3538886 [Favolaschia claudopus]|uniref:Uncharacterized protein n=1 Tax=Favolaschia claudopus TaxID=2862362 RepID=A0AAW0B962_9AGAR
MSLTQTKDGSHAIFLYKTPPALSLDQFERLIDGLMDQVVVLPVIQENLNKLDMIFQTNAVDNQAAAFGFPPRDQIVVAVGRSETFDQWSAVMQSPDVRALFNKGKAFGLDNCASLSAIDVYSAQAVSSTTGVNTNNTYHLFFAYNVPPDLAASKTYDLDFNEFLEGFLKVPVVQKNVVDLKSWKYSSELDDSIGDFGYSRCRTLLSCAVVENADNLMEIMNDPAAQQYVLDSSEGGGDQQFNLKKNGYMFTANFESKIST